MIMLYSTMYFLFFIWLFFKNNSFYLNSLIILEAMMLSLIMFFYSTSIYMMYSSYMFLFLLGYAASEAALGLSVLVSVIRLWGNDNMKNSLSWLEGFFMIFLFRKKDKFFSDSTNQQFYKYINLLFFTKKWSFYLEGKCTFYTLKKCRGSNLLINS